MEKKPEARRKLLEELKELFGPAFGPALEAHGRSFAERLRDDEGFATEARKLFEEGEERGEFPALSGLLAGASDEEREEFFRDGWGREVLPPSCSTPRKPWDFAPWYGNFDAYREDLYSGMAFGHPDLRAFAQEWLDELARVGYYGMEEALGLPLKQQADDLSVMPGPLPKYGEAYPVRFEDTGQTVWLKLDGPRSTERGYRKIVVSDEPLRTDTAIIAAMTALEGRQLDIGRLREVLPKVMPFPGESFWDRWKAALSGGSEGEAFRELCHHQALDYVLSLLRYHRPGFDDLPVEERAGLVADTCAHINGLLETMRKLATFLEHGRPGRRGPTATRVTARDVAAAVLKDVDGFTYKEIGKEFGMLFPADFGHKGDHSAVRKMVVRGRKVLEQALGAEGWWTQAESMRAEKERWLSLSEMEREAELEAEALNVPFEEVLRRLKKEWGRQGGGAPGIG